MPEKMQPASNEDAPDPSNSYERAHPERESSTGRLDSDKRSESDHADSQHQAVTNRQNTARQVNGEETQNRAAADQPDHSMKEEEPLGSDLAPNDIHDPRQKRHPRTEGKGGTP